MQPPLFFEQRPAFADRWPVWNGLERREDELALDLFGHLGERDEARSASAASGSSTS